MHYFEMYFTDSDLEYAKLPFNFLSEYDLLLLRGARFVNFFIFPFVSHELSAFLFPEFFPSVYNLFISLTIYFRDLQM